MGDGVPWLEGLPETDSAALRALGVERHYPAGVMLFHHGDDPGSVSVLLEGWVKFVLPGPQGKEIILGFAGPGEIVGELGAIDGGARSASAEAVDAVRALVVPRATFERFVETHPAATLSLLRTLARRLRVADAQRLEFAVYDVVGRVARRIVELCERHGESGPDGVLITLPLSQDELAAWSASSREAVAKALHLLRELGWIETQRRRIVVRLDTVIGAKPESALLAATVGTALFTVGCPAAGALSDRVGRKRMLMSGATAFALLIFPLFLLVGSPEISRMIAGFLGLQLLVLWFNGPLPATISEMFPAHVRFSGIALSYNVASAVFAGTSPLIATALVKTTGWDQSPALYVIAASLVALIVLANMPEPSRIDPDAAAARKHARLLRRVGALRGA